MNTIDDFMTVVTSLMNITNKKGPEGRQMWVLWRCPSHGHSGMISDNAANLSTCILTSLTNSKRFVEVDRPFTKSCCDTEITCLNLTVRMSHMIYSRMTTCFWYLWVPGLFLRGTEIADELERDQSATFTWFIFRIIKNKAAFSPGSEVWFIHLDLS